jgi:hypothetical protein
MLANTLLLLTFASTLFTSSLASVSRRDEKPLLPYDPNTTKSCTWWFENDGSVACDDMPAAWAITLADFRRWVVVGPFELLKASQGSGIIAHSGCRTLPSLLNVVISRLESHTALRLLTSLSRLLLQAVLFPPLPLLHQPILLEHQVLHSRAQLRTVIAGILSMKKRIAALSSKSTLA